MAKRKTFWTPKKLIELRVKAKTLSHPQLADYFERPIEDITQALIYEANKRRLACGTRIEIIDGKKYQVKIFSAWYADGALQINSDIAQHTIM